MRKSHNRSQQRAHDYYNNKDRPQNKQRDKPLTSEELYDVLSFAQGYYNAVNGLQGLPSIASPSSINQGLSSIGLSSGQISQSGLKAALKNPIENQKALIGYSEFLKFTDSVAKRTYSYMGNLATFDMTFYCNNISSEVDYLSNEYADDFLIFKNIISKFDYKTEFSKIVKRMLENDTYYGVFRMDSDRYGFQELPYTHCLLSGKTFGWGLLFDFNMNWFVDSDVDIKMYPSIFKEMYNRVFNDKSNNRYDPANRLTARNGTWGLWTQTSPIPEEGGFAAFKWNNEIYANIPFLTSLFNDAINRDLVRDLQNNQYIIASQKLLVGLIPLLKESKSGSTKDMLAISPDTMGKFLGLLQQGLREIMVKGVPFGDVKEVTYDIPDKSIYSEYNANLAGSSGVTAHFVNTENAKTAMEIKANMVIDSSIIENGIYGQFSNWLSTLVNHYTKKYKFTIVFKGTQFNRQDRFDMAMRLADKGLVDFSEIASSIGEDYFSFHEKIRQSAYSDIWSIIKLLPNTNTMSEGSVGRPPTSDPADSTDRNINRLAGGGEK